MNNIIVDVENLSKLYRLGQIGTGTLSRDLEIWFAKIRGKPNPYLKIGQTDPSELDGQTLWALSDVSFQVQQGEVLGIIGRNGAGKSTLLKILSRVTAPTSGQIKVKGRIASLLEVGTGFHPELTGRENIFLNGAILGMSKQDVQRKFDEIVSFAEVEKFVDTPVKRYSSGMYVRLAFAVAAHLESEILLVDEVLAVGDAEFQKKCLGKMGDVATNEGRTVFFVSHNMAAVSSLCNIFLLLSHGKIDKYGRDKNIINHYLGNFDPNHLEKKNDSIVQVKNINIDGFDNSFFPSSKDLNLIFDLFLKHNFWDVIVHITIRNQENIIILHEKVNSQKFPELKLSGQYLIKIFIKSLNLKSGMYYCNFKIVVDAPGGRQRFSTDPFVINFDDEDDDFDNPGLLRPKPNWVIQKMDS